jgi:predicted nuclease with TOPRIM domain
MRTMLDNADHIFQIVTGLALLGCFIVSLMIKSSLSTIRESQLRNQLDYERHQAAMKEEFMETQSKIRSDLRDHETRDEGQFREIRASLNRIEHWIAQKENA